MTDLLAKAFSEASKLSTHEQDKLAAWILEELTSEQRWEANYAKSADKLAQLADEALAEHSAHRTQELIPDRL